VVSAVAGDDGKAATIIPEIEAAYGPYVIHHRSTADSLLNPDIAALIQESRRRTILIAGVATELAVQLPALTAPEMGYRAALVLDACGGMSERTERAAIARITQAGSTTTCVMTLGGEPRIKTPCRVRSSRTPCHSHGLRRWRGRRVHRHRHQGDEAEQRPGEQRSRDFRQA